MVITIREIISTFKNKRDLTYRCLCCLNRAENEISFEATTHERPGLDDPQRSEFEGLQRNVTNAIRRMASILISGSKAGCAPSPYQELRDHLVDFKIRNETIVNTSINFKPKQVVKNLETAIELLDKIEG